MKTNQVSDKSNELSPRALEIFNNTYGDILMCRLAGITISTSNGLVARSQEIAEWAASYDNMI